MSERAKHPVRAVIFDIDGTLLDSNDAHAEAFVIAMGEHGFTAERHVVRRAIGKGADKLLPETIGVPLDSPVGAAIVQRKGALFRQRWLSRLRPTPGARLLVSTLARRGLRLAAATSASQDEMASLLAQAGVGDLIEHRVAAEQAGASKPDPDVVLAVLAKLGMTGERNHVIAVGDTPYDVESARRSGIRAIALRCGGWGDGDLGGATAIYDDPAHLARELPWSPLGSWS